MTCGGSEGGGGGMITMDGSVGGPGGTGVIFRRIGDSVGGCGAGKVE